MKEIYEMYCKYNVWANKKLSALFSELPEELADKTIESSFPSAKKTLLHIWDAELIWLMRLQEKTVTDFPSKSFNGATLQAIEGLNKTSADFLNFVAAQPASFFQKEFTVKTITSGVYTQKAFEMVHHCMNHSTYHRGQLLMMARQLGMRDLPSTDMIFYLRENQ